MGGMKCLTAAAILLLASCASVPKKPVRTCEVRGEVIRVDSQVRTAVIRHHQICDWMGPMTMEFPVRDERDFNALKPGSKIKATVYIGDPEFWIAGVHPAD